MKQRPGLSIPFTLYALNRNLGDVRLLLEAGRAGARTTWATRKALEVVSRSAVVLGCACWEAFVEDLALDAIAFLVRCSQDHRQLPRSANQIAERALSRLGLQASNANVRRLLQQRRDRVLGTFNTPKAANVDALFESA